MAGAEAQITNLQSLLQDARQEADDARQESQTMRQESLQELQTMRQESLQELQNLRNKIRKLQDELMEVKRKLAECEARHGSMSGELWWMASEQPERCCYTAVFPLLLAALAAGPLLGTSR